MWELGNFVVWVVKSDKSFNLVKLCVFYVQVGFVELIVWSTCLKVEIFEEQEEVVGKLSHTSQFWMLDLKTLKTEGLNAATDEKMPREESLDCEAELELQWERLFLRVVRYDGWWHCHSRVAHATWMEGIHLIWRTGGLKGWGITQPACRLGGLLEQGCGRGCKSRELSGTCSG